MTSLSPAQQATLRTRPQQTQLHMSIFQPQIVMKCRLNNASAAKGDRTIPYDTVSLGNFNAVKANCTMWVGSTDGAQDLGKIRVRSATSSQFIVSENSNIDWQDNAFLTIFYYFELWPVFPRIIPNPNNEADSIFYKDYDIPYTNQNSILGSFVCMGPHRAVMLDPASGQARQYWTATGTYNVLGDALTYDWWFQGATVTGSTSAVPGYVTYNSPGHYVTRLTVTDSVNGAQDTSYRYVSVYNQANPPTLKWQLLSLSGTRDEGGYTASFKVFQSIPIQEHAVVVLFGDSWYGNTQQNIGGNYPNAGDIFWVGYVDTDSINYDYQHSEVTFSAHSITQMMREASGFSVSVESKASPSKWYELLDMDGRRALYHYLRWHTTAMNIADFQVVGADAKIQFFDSDRESMYDAIDNFMRDTLWGKVVSDRQGKVWMEVKAEAYTIPSSSFPPLIEITNRDWMNEPSIDEQLSEDVSFIEMGGIAYSGTATGTFSALLASAPGLTPGFHGQIETHEGLALQGQSQLNQLAGNVFANRNSSFPSVSMELATTGLNFDVAPQEGVGIRVLAGDTVRNIEINGLYLTSDMTWTYSAQDQLLILKVGFSELVDGEIGETILVVPPEEQGAGFNVPGLQIPPLPPLAFPPFVISNTGASCCDTIDNLGIGDGVFCCTVVRPQPTPAIGCNTPQTDVRLVVPQYSNNQLMYDPVRQRVVFLNTGTMTFYFEFSGIFTQLADPNTPGAGCSSQCYPVLYDGTNDSYFFPNPISPLLIQAGRVPGTYRVEQINNNTTLTLTDSRCKAPNYIQIFSTNGLCTTAPGEDWCTSVGSNQWSNVKLKVCNIPP